MLKPILPSRCPACRYELARDERVTCPECGRRMWRAEITSFWARQHRELRAARRWFLIGGIGLVCWAAWLAGVGAREGDLAGSAVWVVVFGGAGALSGACWLVLSRRMKGWFERPFLAARSLSAAAKLFGGLGLFFGCYGAIAFAVTLLTELVNMV